MRNYILFQQDFGAPPPPPPSMPPPPPPVGMQGDKASQRAIWALVLGIASWTICPILITGIIAWIMGKKEINEINAGLSPQAGKTMATVGMWLGIIHVVFAVLGLLVFIVLLIFGGLMESLN
ncbi:MAG: DUF4190 domain-containing protein [Ignavibacteriae bacterium]|nr:MAG: DUF4190 domain-containing protein [Ignavibacteriota bacterium]